MSTHAHPEYHAALLQPALYHPDAPRKVRFEETRRSYLYRTGEHVYKLRKTSAIYSSPAIKERYAQFALTLGRRWAGPAVEAVLPVLRTADGYALGDGAGAAHREPVDYVLRMAQLPEPEWLNVMLAAGKATPEHLERIGRFLAERHAEAPLEEKAAEVGHPDRVQELLMELLYQSRKHVGSTVSEPMLEMITRPLTHALEQLRKPMLRRLRRGRIVDGHGAFVPEHLCLHGDAVLAFAPLDALVKFRQLDAANDVATLLNALVPHQGAPELMEALLKRYMSAAKDRDLLRLLPVYRTLQAVRRGLSCSEGSAELPAEDPRRKALAEEAGAAYNLALQMAKEVPRSP